MTCRQVAERAGLSEAYVRAACRRRHDPIPHIECGSRRPVIRVRWAAFEKWLEAEEHRQK